MRTLWYFLTQAVGWNDCGYFVLMVAAHPYKNLKLLSFPYYTKNFVPGDESWFKHMDLKVPEPLASSHGNQLIPTTVLLDDNERVGVR